MPQFISLFLVSLTILLLYYSSSSSSAPSSSLQAHKLCRLISLVQLQRYCGVHRTLSSQEKTQLARDFCKKFQDGLRFGLSLPSTVDQLSDFFMVVAIHLLMEVYEETGGGRGFVYEETGVGCGLVYEEAGGGCGFVYMYSRQCLVLRRQS